MSVSHTNLGLQLPESLEAQLGDFRRRLWIVKAIEALAAAVFGVAIAYLVVFAIDRILDTPAWLRTAMFALGVASCAFVFIHAHRWIWRQRRLEALARLLSRRNPSLGDQLLGIIELVRSEFAQSGSRALCEAAIHQVATSAESRNFLEAVPHPRHRRWTLAAIVPTAIAVCLLALYPEAAANAWLRFARPWQSVPRYTFATIEPLPDRLVVPHGEAATIVVRLRDDSRWQPSQARGSIGAQPPIVADLSDGRYELTLPPQIDSGVLELRVGDARHTVAIEPKLRPELASIAADVQLPDYLERETPLHKDVRGGVLSVVNGSQIRVKAIANRPLSSAMVDGQATRPTQAEIESAIPPIDSARKLVVQWRDEFGLSGQDPFTLTITAREDEAPTLVCEDLPRQRIVLVSEVLNFKVRAQDDFGVRRVGIEWRGADSAAVARPAEGEQLLAAGSSDKESLELAGTFCAETLKIEPQPLSVRIFAEDYYPGRPRAYSPTYNFYVLSAEQHYAWLTEQLSKWHRQSLEVRDREMQLHHANLQLRMLSDDELDQPDTRRRIEAQSAAERANGRRLTALVGGGEELVRQAMRNPEFGVGHLEKWAEMIAILKDISANRMPNVADLLKASSQATGMLAESPTNSGPAAGQQRTAPSGEPSSAESKPRPPVPQVADQESSHGTSAKKDGQADDPAKAKSNPRVTLPVTTVTGSGNKKPGQSPEAAKLDEAVKVQQDLLAEFEKIADELNKVLANLEGSTLVKRLKAASREQYQIAGKISEQVADTFNGRAKAGGPSKQMIEHVATLESASSQKVSNIMDDLQAYFERRRYQRFKSVLDEMRQEDAVGSLRQLSDDVRAESGLSMAQCEFWSDTFDRWAENLVDPACAGKCPGGKSKSSLPPSIVLEAMQILEAEVNLREETRVAEQARTGLTSEEFGQRAGGLKTTQDGLTKRVADLAVRIGELPDGEQEFAREIALLGRVELAMQDAATILNRPETGSEAIAAETEAIELLLQSKRINPRGGGAGGSSPGGGGGGSTNDSALALIGAGVNDKEVREDRGVSHSTGETGTPLPEEFRAGLDEYFNKLERSDSQ